MAKEKSYVRGRANQACCALLDALRIAGVYGVAVGHSKGVLHVMLSNAEADGPKVPKEFEGYVTKIHQDPIPAPPRLHKKVGDGCAHSRWEIMQYEQHGIVPNKGCLEPSA